MRSVIALNVEIDFFFLSLLLSFLQKAIHANVILWLIANFGGPTPCRFIYIVNCGDGYLIQWS
jgi:hypothetical protein